MLFPFLLAAYLFCTNLAVFAADHETVMNNHYALHYPTCSHSLITSQADDFLLLRRQADSTVTSGSGIASTMATQASAIDFEEWDADTSVACGSAVDNLGGEASNPSGLAGCYNVLFLDVVSGVFQSELRLYNVSAPEPPWAGVVFGDINLMLSYSSATVQMIPDEAMQDSMPPKSSQNSFLMEKRQTRQALAILRYIGKLNKEVLDDDNPDGTFKAILLPAIRINAKSPTSEGTIETTISPSDASYVNGVFAINSNGSSIDDSNELIPVVIPGVELAIFPVGFIVTMAWTALLIATVCIGSFGRIQFREKYRRTVQREKVAHISRI